MRNIVYVFLLILTSVQAKGVTKVLFIGNSLTYYNNMPKIFEAIANSKLDSTEVTVYAPGGTGFIDHVNDTNVNNHFKQGDWDYVVLQPGSSESAGYSEPIYATLKRAKKLKDSILYYNPCAKILYYEISYGVYGNLNANLLQYNTTMDLIKSNLIYLSDSTKQGFVPVGEAFKTAWNTSQTTMFWGQVGDIHPNLKGSYITACTFYASIFNKPSLGSTVLSGLTNSEAKAYQTLADTTVLNYLPNWKINSYNLKADYSYVKNGGSNVLFFDKSLNADSVYWDFNDGNQSNLLNPNHTYYSNGTYLVKHTAYKNGCEKDTVQSVSIGSLSIDNLSDNLGLQIYPNPTKGLLFIKNPTITDHFQLRVITISGTEVLNRVFANNKSIRIDLSNYPKGLYFVNLTTNKTKITKKILLN